MAQKTTILDFDKAFIFGDVLVEPMLNRLSQGSCSVQMERQVMLLLVHLSRHAGEPMAREALYQAVWAEGEPNDEALTQAVSKLRKALTDVGGEKGMIETIRKVGYRVTAEVNPASSDQTVEHPGPLALMGATPTTRNRKRMALWASAAAVVLLALTSDISIQSHHISSDPEVRVVRITLDTNGQKAESEWVTEDIPEDVLASLPENVEGAVAFVHKSMALRTVPSKSSAQNDQPAIE